jgi:hypothetical protein
MARSMPKTIRSSSALSGRCAAQLAPDSGSEFGVREQEKLQALFRLSACVLTGYASVESITGNRPMRHLAKIARSVGQSDASSRSAVAISR